MDRLHVHKHTMCLSTHIMGLLPRSCLLLVVVVVLLVPDATAQNISSTTEATTVSGAPADCNTDICVKSCAGCDIGVQVPDPENCRQFYLCDGEGGYIVDEPVGCDPGEVFNATDHMCVPGEDCKTCPTPEGGCFYECATLASSGKIAHLTECQYYYECENPTDGNPTPNICPADTPFFDGEDCVDDETKCCSCHPYCPTDAILYDVVADPLDCRNFYICLELGEVPTTEGTCTGEGEYFDSILGDCYTGVECVTQCTNVVGADGCIEPLTCLETGYFARCPSLCTPDYYHCTEATGEYQDVESCTGGAVYNPDTHTCVATNNCPYPIP